MQTQVDVIIVGAGWAGMAAADMLARANVSFLILEASDRTGGRVHPLQFGDPSIWRGVVERGANWVSGVAPPGVTKGGAGGTAKGFENVPYENPIHALAREAKLSMTRIAGSADGNMSAYEAVYTSGGNANGDAGGEIRRAADAALDCINRSWARAVSVKMTMRAGLQKCGWQPRTEEQFAVDWAMSGEDANGAPARIESLKSFAPDPSYVWPDDYFVIDQRPRGFSGLIDTLTRDSVPPGDKRVIFGSEVVSIDYGHCGRGIKVETRNGRVFRALHEVISTLPLGVMRHQHEAIFTPPLPKAQAEVFSPRSRFVMGNLTHVVVQFPRVWWNNTLFKWLQSNKGSNVSSEGGGPDGGGPDAAGEFSLWHNLNHVSLLPGSQTLLTFLGDPQSSRYEAMSNADVQTALMRRLRLQHPNIATSIPEPTAFFISRHGYDPLSWGAYSISLAGWDDTLHDQMTQPLTACGGEVKVRLAGEAMCDNLNGYTHGALQSGKESAAWYLYKHGLGPDPRHDRTLSLCSF